jgi:hypothetical protein
MVDNKNLVEAEQSRRISSALCQHVWIRERLIDRGIMVEYIGTYLGAHILRNIFFSGMQQRSTTSRAMPNAMSFVVRRLRCIETQIVEYLEVSRQLVKPYCTILAISCDVILILTLSTSSVMMHKKVSLAYLQLSSKFEPD